VTRGDAAYRRPESVLVIVYTDDGETLLLHRRQPFPFWQSVTGSLEPGESADRAAARELAEETGLADHHEVIATGVSRRFEIDPRWRRRYAPGVTDNVEYEFRCRLPGRREIALCDSEHSAAEWLTLEDAVDRVWSWTNKAALLALLEERNSA